MNRIGVAISTTGDKHRLGFLETCVEAWDAALPTGASLFVTVDGDEEAAQHAASVVSPYSESVFRVGQPGPDWDPGLGIRDGRLGVAINKNTGLELLMDNTRVSHLFLCDDDTWPRSMAAIEEFTDMDIPHAMVCWGRHRRPTKRKVAGVWHGEWTWPRGVLLYARRSVVECVGGMIESFGPGGHEHVEWSRRIHQAGLTPAMFPSPARHVDRLGMGAADLWNCEDMAKPREPMGNLRLRRRNHTSIRRTADDWPHIEQIMAARDGNTDFVPFRAHQNGRLSATMTENLMGQGAGGEG